MSFRLVLVSAITVLATACGGGYSSPTPVPTPQPLPTEPSTPVSIPIGASSLGNRAFSPDNLEVTAGTTVTWTNTDSIAHTTTSDGNVWDSGAVAPRGQFSRTFATAGTFSYHCAIHPGMVGTITVH